MCWTTAINVMHDHFGVTPILPDPGLDCLVCWKSYQVPSANVPFDFKCLSIISCLCCVLFNVLHHSISREFDGGFDHFQHVDNEITILS